MGADYLLYAVPGTGSAIVEAQLALAAAPVSTIDLPYEELGPGSGELQKLNPLGQSPTLVLPEGTVMTESAAITLHLAERFPAARLAPDTDDPLRPAFLRRLVFFGSPLYATFTYGDTPERWTLEGDAAKALRKATDAHREFLWRYLEAEIRPSPWLLGSAFSALDLFVSVMSYWRPGRAWFAQNCPKLHAIARAVDGDARLAAVWERNFS